MKAKNLTLVFASVLALIMLVSFTSAYSHTTDEINVNVTQDLPNPVTPGSVYNITINVTNGNEDQISLFWDDTSDSSGITSSVPNASFLDAGEIEEFTLTYTIPSDFAGEFEHQVHLNVIILAEENISRHFYPYSLANYTEPETEPETSDTPTEIEECSLIGNSGNNLRIKDIEFTNEGIEMGDAFKKFGEDDAWFPLDNIKVEIELENNGEEDIDDVEVQWGLYNADSGEWIIELDDEKDFDIKDDDSKTLTISFNLENSLDIDLEDLESGDYRFYVIANGYDKEIDEDVCVSDYETAEIVIEDDFVIVTNFEFQNTASCGNEIELVAEVWNIGDNDQDDVSVRVYNSELGIDQSIEIGDIDALDNEELRITLEIPGDADEKTYGINFDVYDEDNDIYENDYDDDEAKFYVTLNVDDCRPNVKAVVSATLESGGVAGEEMIVKATVLNTGDDVATFAFNVAGYSTWADSADMDTTSFSINAGESKEITIKFNIKEDVSGEETFVIEAISEGQLVLNQPVSITIAEAEKGFFSSITGNVIGGGNAYLWIIGALNIILVIIIIIVAIRVAKQ